MFHRGLRPPCQREIHLALIGLAAVLSATIKKQPSQGDGSVKGEPNPPPFPRSSGVPNLLLDILGISKTTTTGVVVACCLLLAGAVFLCIWSAPPATLTMTAGPEGSIFHTNAMRYADALAKQGVRLRVLSSRGSFENLQRLDDPRQHVDVGFVLGGVTNDAVNRLFSLGSISYQPLFLFYRGEQMDLLSSLEGKRVAIGPSGSGTRSLALNLLEMNGIKSGEKTALLELEPRDSAKALLDGSVDAAFLMGEDAPTALLREMMRAPNVHLFSFKQAVAYTRRISYLNVLELPEGVIDFGKNIPNTNVFLIGPTVELIARDRLHPALSDLLLEAARKVHGRAGLLQRKGEFPAPLEHDFRLSSDAVRFYKTGKTLFYRYLPFWLATLISRIVVVFVPMVIVLIPIIRSAPRIYTWRVRSRIYRWYRALLALEREWAVDLSSSDRKALLRRLDEIDEGVNKLKVPAFAADLYYDLRGHIRFVRRLVNHQVNK